MKLFTIVRVNVCGMANVLLVSSAPPQPFDPWKHGTHFLFQHSAKTDASGTHQIAESPEEADLILFTEMGECGEFAERVRAHPYYRSFRKKCFLFDSGDTAYPVLPGLYASMTKQHYRPDHCRTGFYLYLVTNSFVNFRPMTGKEKYLASFIGSVCTHPVRSKLLNLQHPEILAADTSSISKQMMYHGSGSERAKFWSSYADSIADAKFSLCPRGKCTNSIRLYESMQMGRACVIISDDWQPNDGVDWDACSIRVAEAEVDRLPEILEQAAGRASEMGLRARAEWEKNFSPQVLFHTVVEQCLAIQRERGDYSRLRSYREFRHILKHPRRYLSSKRNLYRNNGIVYW